MQITPIVSPSIPTPSGSSVQIQADARSRAINKLMESSVAPTASPVVQTAQEHPVKNPTAVTPEEIGALKQGVTPEVDHTGQVNSVVEATTPTEPEATAKLSSQYAILARKEKALRSQYQKLQADREAFAQERRATQAPPSIPDQYIDKQALLSDPFGTLSKLGVSYEQITNAALNQPTQEEQAFKRYQLEMDEKIKRIEESHKKSQEAMEQSQKNQYDQALAQIRTEVKHLVNHDPAYETIKLTGQSHEVTNLILETFNKGLNRDYPKGTILPIEVAAQMVEDHIIEQSLKLDDSRNIQARRLAQKKPQLSSQLDAHRAAVPPQQQQQMRTLTNATSTTRQMSPRERAILAFNNQLK